MPKFEDFSITKDTGLDQKQIKETNELTSSSQKPDFALDQPIAPHRGEAVEYTPSRSQDGISDSKEDPLGSTQGNVIAGNSRARRNIRIRNAYTKKTLPASIAHMPKSPKGPSLFIRLKTFLISLLKRIWKKNQKQAPRWRNKRRRNRNRREPSRRGNPRRRGRASNQGNRTTNFERKRNGTQVGDHKSQEEPQSVRNFSIIRDSKSDGQSVENGPNPKNLARRRNRSQGKGQRKPDSSTN